MSARGRSLCRVVCLAWLVVGTVRLIGWGLGWPVDRISLGLTLVSVAGALVGLVSMSRRLRP